MLYFKFRFIEHFQIIIVGGGALDAPQKHCRRRAVQGAGPYILKFKQLDKLGFMSCVSGTCNMGKNVVN